MLDAWTSSEFFLGGSSEVEEVSPEPDLFDVGLVTAFCDDLLDCVLLFALLVLSQPHQREPSPSQQLDLIEPIRKAISKHLYFLLAEVVGVLLLFFPLELYFLERLLSIWFDPFGAVLEGYGVLGCALFCREFVLFPREWFVLLDTSLLVLLFLQSVLQLALLAVGVQLLLVAQLQIL